LAHVRVYAYTIENWLATGGNIVSATNTLG